MIRPYDAYANEDSKHVSLHSGEEVIPDTETDDDSSPIALFVLSLVILQVTANPDFDARGEIYTLQSRDDGLTKRARKPDYQAHPAGELVCRPFGLCEPCPVDEVSPTSFLQFSIE